MTAREPIEVGLSLGSNLGDRLGFLRAARDSIAALPGVRVIAQSPVYETEPVGAKPEYVHLAYLNAVVIIAADRPITVLHDALQRIEEGMGRVRRADRYAPRTVDIDILYAGSSVTQTDRLTVPHPRWADRRFVVQPLADVRPDLVLPGMTCGVQAWLAGMPTEPAVRLHTREW